MTFPDRPPLKGWTRWQTSRRRALRKAGVLDCAGCTRMALAETRCRANLSMVLGKSEAKKIRLVVCYGGQHGDPEFSFLLADPIEPVTWWKIQDVPGLMRTILE